MSETRERQFGDLTVRIQRDRCIASGNCTKVAPQVFTIDAEGCVAFEPGAADAAVESARIIEACDVCPVDALFVIDGQGRQIVPG